MKSRKLALVLAVALFGVLASGCAIPPILQGVLGAAGRTASPAPGAAPAAAGQGAPRPAAPVQAITGAGAPAVPAVPVNRVR